MDALVDFLRTTPFRTIALIVGFLVLSIGYGLRIKIGIDVDNVNKTYAKIAGGIFLLLGLALYMPDTILQPSLEDPFLPYYIVSILIAVVFTGAILKLTSGQQQLVSIKRFFVFVSTLLSLVVLWRAIVVYFFVAGGGISDPPLGFQVSGGNYLPYLVLLSIGLAVITWLIYSNTNQPDNSKNRISIFQYFIVLCIYLGGCRVTWEIVDLIGKNALATH